MTYETTYRCMNDRCAGIVRLQTWILSRNEFPVTVIEATRHEERQIRPDYCPICKSTNIEEIV